MTIQTLDNKFAVAKWIVDPVSGLGTHTTIASALASSSSGDTIFIKPGTYTENLTLVSGVNLSAFECDSQTPNVIIVGNCTFSSTGTVSLSGIRLQTNGSFCLTVSGANASVINLIQCYLNCLDNTGISFTSSNASSVINLLSCKGDLGAIGAAIFTASSSGILNFRNCQFSNSAGSTTSSSTSSTECNLFSCIFTSPFSTTSTGVLIFTYCNLNTENQNSTCLTTAGTGISLVDYCDFSSGTASAIDIGAGTTVQIQNNSRIDSSNANIITGAGTLLYGSVYSTNTNSEINPTTLTPAVVRNAITRSTLQPAFLATHTVAQPNVTGNGVNATVNFTTEIYDQNSNYDGTNTFTAPYTGKYFFSWSVYINDAATSTFGLVQLVTSNRTYLTNGSVPFPLGTVNQYQLCGSILADMDAGDTALIQVNVSGMAGNTADIPIAAEQTFFSGYLVC